MINVQDFATIQQLVASESHASHRSRLEQFIYATICAWPHLTILQAAQAAVQLARPMRIFELQGFEGVSHSLNHIDLRSALEWQILGFQPRDNAAAILLSNPDPLPDEEPTPPLAFYMGTQVVDVENSGAAIPTLSSHINRWKKRRGRFHGPATYAGFHRAFTEDTARMLGNIAKIGALATWEDTKQEAASWAELPHPPAIIGDTPPQHLTTENAWYHFRIGKHLGRDAFAEIALCLGNVFCHHLPQVWTDYSLNSANDDPRGVLLESEAAGSIAIARIGGPARRGGSFFKDALFDANQPLPENFDLCTVLAAATEIQELLQGDSLPVVGANWYADDPYYP